MSVQHLTKKFVLFSPKHEIHLLEETYPYVGDR